MTIPQRYRIVLIAESYRHHNGVRFELFHSATAERLDGYKFYCELFSPEEVEALKEWLAHRPRMLLPIPPSDWPEMDALPRRERQIPLGLALEAVPARPDDLGLRYHDAICGWEDYVHLNEYQGFPLQTGVIGYCDLHRAKDGPYSRARAELKVINAPWEEDPPRPEIVAQAQTCNVSFGLGAVICQLWPATLPLAE